jgi:hypothetical protein
VISQQLQQYDGRLAICPPKTPHSTRVIALDHTTVAALRAHRDRQGAEAGAYGPGYRKSGFVFTNLNGDPMAPDRLTRTFRQLAAALPVTGPVSPEQLQVMEADLLEMVRSRHTISRSYAAGLDVEKAPGQLATSRFYTGLDGIYVELGS